MRKIIIIIAVVVICICGFCKYSLAHYDMDGFETEYNTVTKIYTGYLSPFQSDIEDGHVFTEDEAILFYRPDCIDCQEYTGKIRKALNNTEKKVYYVCSRSSLGKKLMSNEYGIEPEWVPSVVFFTKDGHEIVEIHVADDVEKIESTAKRLESNGS